MIQFEQRVRLSIFRCQCDRVLDMDYISRFNIFIRFIFRNYSQITEFQSCRFTAPFSRDVVEASARGLFEDRETWRARRPAPPSAATCRREPNRAECGRVGPTRTRISRRDVLPCASTVIVFFYFSRLRVVTVCFLRALMIIVAV